MASTELVPHLALLLADPVARSAWRTNPLEYAEAVQCPALTLLDPTALERQAQGLLNKRWHEVHRLLLEADRARFMAYAVQHWPEGADRHRADAAAFREWVRQQL